MSTFDELQAKLRTDTEKSLKFFGEEFAKFIAIVRKDVDEIVAMADAKIQEAYRAEEYHTKLKAEVTQLETKKQQILTLEAEINEKAKQVEQDAQDNISIHKVLENRGKVLSAREAELKAKQRRMGGI